MSAPTALRPCLVLAVVLSGTACAEPDSHESAAGVALPCEALTGPIAALDALPAKVLSSGERIVDDAGPVCEVSGYAAPQSQFTLRVPANNWNGRLLFQGCGGFCGSIYIDRANDALVRGYATVATNMGHVGTALDAVWAYDNPVAEVDFAYRATHRVARAAEILLTAHRREPSKHYFRGCSTGGRQGLMAAQRYPEDFDGIIAGAPVIDYLHGSGLQLLWSVLIPEGADDRPALTSDDVAALAAHVRERCDALDGRVDDVLDEPRRCAIDWAAPICESSTGHCLNETAKAAARAIYAGPFDGEAGLRGPEFGSESNWIGNYVGSGGRPALYGGFMRDLFRYLAFESDPGPDWTPRLEDFDRYLADSAAQHALFSATDPDLRAFADRGGKLLIYHGWQDQSVVPQSTIDYLDAVAAFDRSGDGPAAPVRGFLIPGMNHCHGGPGIHTVDWLSVLETWDATGTPPDSVTAADSASGRSREIHAYPEAPGPVRSE